MYKVFSSKKITKRKRTPRKIRPLKVSLKDHMKNKELPFKVKKDVEMADEKDEEAKLEEQVNFDKDGGL